MKKSVVIFEAEGGSDKTFNGHRTRYYADC